MKIIIYILLCIAALEFGGCSTQEADIFSHSPAERLNKALKDDSDSLQNADNGWAMEYFATAKSPGYTLLMKFSKSGQAIVSGKSELTNNLIETDSCLYEMIGDNGPVLTFNTYNKVLHAFANPVNPDGYGLEGDYEFVVMKSTAGQIVLKGKKRGTTILLNKIPATVSWQKYFADLDAMNTFLFGGATYPLNLVFGTDKLVAYNGASHIFTIAKPGEDPIINGTDYPFIITRNGLRFQTMNTFNTYSYQNFKLSDDKKQLVSVENPPVYITGSILNKFLSSDLSLWKVDVTQMSDNFKTIIQNLSDSLIVKYSGNRNFEYLAITNNATYGNSFLIKVTGVEATFRVVFSPVKGTSDRISISLPKDNVNLYDNNGKKFYTEVPAIRTTLVAFSGDYILTTESPFNAKSVKYTRVDNTSQYFVVNK